jgi:hypothetical protein
MKALPSFITIALLLFPVPARPAAQDHPDFSGTWILDKAKSDRPRSPSPPSAVGRGAESLRSRSAPTADRSGQSDAGRSVDDLTVTIVQTADELTISGTDGSHRVHPMDGSKAAHKGVNGGEMVSTLKWKGRDLVIESEQPIPLEHGLTGKIEVREVRKLSADGKVMTVETTVRTPGGNQTTKRVFNRSTAG